MFTILVLGRSQFFIRSFDDVTVLIGRALDSDIVLPELTVSRLHCRIHVEQQDFSLEDLSSTNGCCVNGTMVSRRAVIHPMNEIRIGPYTLFLQHGHANLGSYLNRPSTMASDYSDHPTAQVKPLVPARNPAAITQPTRLHPPSELPPLPMLATLRRLIDRLLVSDSDLDAFCLDFFPGAYAKFSAHMDRTSKVSLLLARTPPAEVMRQLRANYPTLGESAPELQAY